jgi:hypothetical protein
MDVSSRNDSGCIYSSSVAAAFTFVRVVALHNSVYSFDHSSGFEFNSCIGKALAVRHCYASLPWISDSDNFCKDSFAAPACNQSQEILASNLYGVGKLSDICLCTLSFFFFANKPWIAIYGRK